MLGVAGNTGAGGANVLEHADLLDAWPDGPLTALPAGTRMRVALRRCCAWAIGQASRWRTSASYPTPFTT